MTKTNTGNIRGTSELIKRATEHKNAKRIGQGYYFVPTDSLDNDNDPDNSELYFLKTSKRP